MKKNFKSKDSSREDEAKTELKPTQKGRKSYNRSKARTNGKTTRGDKSNDKALTVVGSNDPKWYLYNDQIVADAGSVSYTNPLGVPLYVDPVMFTWGQKNAYVPTVMAFDWIPMLSNYYGVHELSSPINIQCRSIYTKLQSTVSMTLPFAPADLAIHFGAVDSVYIFYKFCQRLYGMWSTYQLLNTSVPKAYFSACGLDFDTMEDYGVSMVDFRTRLNRIAVDLARLFIPKKLKIFERHSYLSSRIYCDSPTQKHQEFIFVPSGVWKFDPTGESTGGSLVWKPIRDSESANAPIVFTQGLKSVLDFLEDLMLPIFNDMDVWMINSYLLRAYKDEEVYKISMIDESYRVVPEYDPEMLLQIHHIDLVGYLENDAEKSRVPKYVQNALDDVTIKHGVSTRFITNNKYSGHIHGPLFLMDMPIDNPTPLDNLVASRFMVKGSTFVWPESTAAQTAIDCNGSEIVAAMLMFFSADYGVNYDRTTMSNIPINAATVSTNIVNPSTMFRIAALSKFAFSPMFKLTNDKSGGTATDNQYTTWYDTISDLNNYTVIALNVLAKMHNAAFMGEWFIPEDVPLDGFNK